MKRYLLLILFLAGISCACSEIDDFTFYTGIKGVVVDSATAEPLSGVIVTINPGGESSNPTDSTGSFEFTDLEPIQYTITAQKEGYQPNRKNITGVSNKVLEVTIPLSLINK